MMDYQEKSACLLCLLPSLQNALKGEKQFNSWRVLTQNQGVAHTLKIAQLKANGLLL